jgi:hypothetical protein
MSGPPRPPKREGSYLTTLKAVPYYHTSLGRAVAEQMLVSEGVNGTYLVRASETKTDSMVLSVGCNQRVHHYRIVYSGGSYRMETHKETTFKTLPELVQHFSDKGLLVTTLTTPITGSEEAVADGDEYADSGSTTDALLHALTRQGATIQSDNMAELTKYVNDNAAGDEELVKSAPDKMQLNKLIVESAQQLTQELTLFHTRMNAIRDMFVHAGVSMGLTVNNFMGDMPDKIEDVEDVITQLATAAAAARDAKVQGMRFLKVAASGVEADDAGNDEEDDADDTSAGHRYEVKRIETMKKVSGFVSINVDAGVVSLEDGKHGANVKEYTHAEVVQVIKSRSEKSKLGIVIVAGRGKPERKNFLFTDARKREEFAQQWQAMKVKHGGLDVEGADQHKKLLVFCGTFNMGEEAAPNDLSQWFQCVGDGNMAAEAIQYDIYAIGTQEQKGSDSDLHQSIQRHIGSDYELLSKVALQQIRLVIFVKKSLITQISHIQTSSAATGVQTGITTLGNKGAVAVSMFLNNTSFCFLNCHLAAGSEKWAKRNANYRDILAKLQLGDRKKLTDFDVTNQFHHVFLFGDLNYRIAIGKGPEKDVHPTLDKIAAGELAELRKYDQLSQQRRSRNVLYGFDEGLITFKPTYRYEKGAVQRFAKNEYAYEKQKSSGVKINVPSWCDRVLHRSFPNQSSKQITYGCTTNITTSDHSPVYAGYELLVANQYVSRNTVSDHKCTLAVRDMTARVMTASKATFYLEFYGAFFDNAVRTAPQFAPVKPISAEGVYNEGSDIQQQIWNEEVSIAPFIPDRKYLESEVVMVVVKSTESNETYGTGRFALVGFGAEQPSTFQCELLHQGAHTGYLQGSAQIRNSIGEGFNMFQEEADEAAGGSFKGSDGPAPMPARRPRGELLAKKKPDTYAKQPAGTRLQIWLTARGLPHMHGPLVASGYDDLDFIGDIDEGDLKDMGLDPGDIATLLAAISTL